MTQQLFYWVLGLAGFIIILLLGFIGWLWQSREAQQEKMVNAAVHGLKGSIDNLSLTVKESIGKVEASITILFSKVNTHETKLSRLEARCDERHKERTD